MSLRLSMAPYNWLGSLQDIVQQKPVVILRISKNQLEILERKGKVTIVREHELLKGIKVPSICILLDDRLINDGKIYLGYLKARRSVATLETRLSIECASEIKTTSKEEFDKMITESEKNRDVDFPSVVPLKP